MVFIFRLTSKSFSIVSTRKFTTRMLRETIQVNLVGDVIDFGLGQPSPSLLPIKQLFNEFSSLVLDEQNEAWRWLQYGKQQGALLFRNSLATFLNQNKYHGDKGSVSEENLFLIPGASAGLTMICQQFLAPKTNGQKTIVFVENPTYHLSLGIFRDFSHIQLIGVPVDRDGIDTEKLEDLVKQHNPDLLYVIPTYHNPTGNTLSLPRRKKLLALSEQYNFIIAADEVYQLLYYGNAPPPPLSALEEQPRVLSIGSFSKILAPGLRLGWIEAKGPLMQRLLNSGTLRSGGSLNHFSSGVVHAALQSGFQQKHLEMLRKVYKTRLSFMISELSKLLPKKAVTDIVQPEGGYFVWISMSEAVDIEKLTETMKEQKVAVKLGQLFSLDNSFKNYVRLSFAYYDEKAIEDGVKRFAKAVSDAME